MPNPIPIQVALQGGGAKLSVLLAAMEAVQKLHRNGDIKVTRVAGTSAGSVAGCLFAADVDMGKVRERLKKFSKKQWNHYFPTNRIKGSLRLLRGYPLWSEDFFRQELAYFFNEKNVKSLEDIYDKFEIQPIVIATNLRTSKAEIYRNEDIIDSILDSCALPYCFRVWSKDNNPVIVDGGICENLPSEILQDDEETFGPVYGISFHEANSTSPKSFLDFTKALLNTSINHSVTRAKQRLGKERVFNIETEISTFDFLKAFSDESDRDYKDALNQAGDFFANIISNKPSITPKIVTSDEWESPNLKFMSNLDKIYESHHMNKKIKYLHGSLEVIANSLQDNSLADQVTFSTTFKTLDTPLQCLALSLNANHDFSLRETKFIAYKKGSDIEIETVYLLANSSIETPTERPHKRLLVYFIPEIPPNSGDYVIILTDIFENFMKPLEEKKRDSLSITPFISDEPVDRLDIVLHVPDHFPKIEMIQTENLGNIMNKVEIMEKYRDTVGYISYGWAASNVNQTLRVELLAD